MSSPKLVYGLVIGGLLAVTAGFIVASEVRADDRPDADDLPLTAAVNDETRSSAAAFAGEFRFVGGQKQREGIDAAIERAVEAVSPVVRKIGRQRLQATNPAFQAIRIDVSGDNIEVRMDGDGHRASLDGTPVRAKSKEGDAIKVSYTLQNGKLRHFIDGKKGDRINVLRLSEDGQRLTLSTKITSSHLPVPVEYKLSYKRK